MAQNDFQYGRWNNYTLQCGTIMTLISPGDCTLQCGMWLWNHVSEFTKWQHPAMWQVALGWHATEFAQTFAILEFNIWFQFWQYHCSRHVILYQSTKFYPNWTTLMGSLKSRCYDYSDHISKLLSFWENSIFCILATDKQTDGQHRCTKLLNRCIIDDTKSCHSSKRKTALRKRK